MTGAPLAYTVHPGGRPPDGQKQQAIARWLPANGINPNLVSAAYPITVLPVPYQTGDDDPLMVQVIVFHQLHVDQSGTPELNLITGREVTFQRTMPLRVPFPADPAAGEESARHIDPEGPDAGPDQPHEKEDAA